MPNMSSGVIIDYKGTKKSDGSKTELFAVRPDFPANESVVTSPKVMKKLKRGSSRSAGFVACKRKNNALRSERVRSAVVVFAFVLSARNVSGRYLRCMARGSEPCSRSVNSFRGSAKHRFVVNAKTTPRGPNGFVPQSLFSHLCLWPAMFRSVIYVACLAKARHDRAP